MAYSASITFKSETLKGDFCRNYRNASRSATDYTALTVRELPLQSIQLLQNIMTKRVP